MLCYSFFSQQKHKTGFVDLENSLVEIDFTSQKEKDLDKRRRFLFRLILSNNMEYLLQAPSENQMLQWLVAQAHTTIIRIQYNTVQYSGVQYSIVEYSTCTVQYNTVQYSTV